MRKLAVAVLGVVLATAAAPALACTINPVPVFMADRAAADITIVEVTRVSSTPVAEPLAGWRDTIEFRTVESVKGAPRDLVTKVLGRSDATPDCPFSRSAPTAGERYVIWFKPDFPDGVYDVRSLAEVRREAPSWPND